MAKLMNDLELAIGSLGCGIRYCDLSGENNVTIGVEEAKNIVKLLTELKQFRTKQGFWIEKKGR